MGTYEVMCTVRPNIEEGVKRALVGHFDGILATEGVEVLGVKDWGKRRLAYKVNDFRDGPCNIVRVRSGNNKVTDEFQCLAKVSSDIIRYMVIREDEDRQ